MSVCACEKLENDEKEGGGYKLFKSRCSFHGSFFPLMLKIVNFKVQTGVDI